MAKSRAKKEREAAALTEKFQRMKSVVLTSTAGLKVKEMTALRSLLRKAGIEYTVVKKTLVKRALHAASLKELDIDAVVSGFSLAFGYGDEVLPAKLLAQFAKTHESLRFLGGVVNGTFLTAEEIEQLSRLPSRDQLRARVVGTIASPLTGLLAVFQGTLRGLVLVLDGHRQKQATTP